MVVTDNLAVVLHDALFNAYGGTFVLDNQKEYPILEKLHSMFPNMFVYKHIDNYIKITKCDQTMLLEIFKADRELSTDIDVLRYSKDVSYSEALLKFLDKLFDYMNSFNNADELRIGLVKVANCLRGSKVPSEEISDLIQDLDKRVEIILKDLLKIAININNLSDFRDKLMYRVYSVLSAIGPAVKRYVSKLGSPELSIVFGDKLTGPIFKQIDDAYLNGKKVLIVYANGFVKQHLDYISNMLNQTGNKNYYLMTGDANGVIIVIACNSFEISYS